MLAASVVSYVSVFADQLTVLQMQLVPMQDHPSAVKMTSPSQGKVVLDHGVTFGIAILLPARVILSEKVED